MDLDLLKLPLLEHFFLLLLLLVYGFLLVVIEIKYLFSVCHWLRVAWLQGTYLSWLLDFDDFGVIEIFIFSLEVLQKLVLKLLGLLSPSILIQFPLPLQLILALLITLLKNSYLNLGINQLNLQLFHLLANLPQMWLSLGYLLRLLLFHFRDLLLQLFNLVFIVIDIWVVRKFLNLHVHFFQLEVMLQL